VDNPAPAPAPRAPRAPRAVPDDAHRCTGRKKDGTQCQNKRKNGEHCGVHAPKEGAAAPTTCTSHLANGNACTRKAVNGRDLCGVHVRTVERARQAVVRTTWWEYDREILNEFHRQNAVRLMGIQNLLIENRHELRQAQEAIPTVAATINRLLTENLALRRLRDNSRARYAYIRHQAIRCARVLPFEEIPEGDDAILARSTARVAIVMHILNAQWNEIERHHQHNRLHAPRIQPTTELGRLAADGQNVHTRAVTQMQEDTLALLGEAEPGMNALTELMAVWTTRNFDTPVILQEVRNDAKRLYKLSPESIAQIGMNGNIYKETLDRVWCFIKRHSMRADLEERLYQEMRDSVRMCYTGHVSRLLNSLQGFDAAPPPVIPVGERLQTAMSQISELEPSERESAARRVFAELGVEGDAQTPWLEALLA